MDLTPTAVAATQQSPPAVSVGRDLVENGAATLEAVPRDIAQLPLFQHLSAVMPVADLLFGGGMLVLIMLVHAAGVRGVTGAVVRRSQRILQRPAMWRADLLMSQGVFMLLALHVLEIFLWAAALVVHGTDTDLARRRILFRKHLYDRRLWQRGPSARMGNAHPIIAISGLFTFGWSGSVLVDLVGRCQKIKDATAAKLAGK